MDSWRDWIPSFDAWATTYDEEVRDSEWFAYERAWAFVRRWAGEGAESRNRLRVADVGCGTGAFLARWASIGASVVGVEPSAGMRAVAATRLPPGAVRDGHLTEIPLPDAHVDAIEVTYAMSHLDAAGKTAALAELRRVVRPGGVVVVVDVGVNGPADLARVREVLTAAGKADQIPWYESGYAFDLPGFRAEVEASDTWLATEALGPVLYGMAWETAHRR